VVKTTERVNDCAYVADTSYALFCRVSVSILDLTDRSFADTVNRTSFFSICVQYSSIEISHSTLRHRRKIGSRLQQRRPLCLLGSYVIHLPPSVQWQWQSKEVTNQVFRMGLKSLLFV
jgi:hypothetical protein